MQFRFLSIPFTQNGPNFGGQNLENDWEISKKNLTCDNIHSFVQNNWKWIKFEDITSWLCLILTDNGSKQGQVINKLKYKFEDFFTTLQKFNWK